MNQENTAPGSAPEQENDKKVKKPKSDSAAKKTAELEKKIAELESELAQTKESLMRSAAEFDNYKKRTSREKDGIYAEAVATAVTKLLTGLDNLERAATAQGDADTIRKGVEMTVSQFRAAFESLGVSEIPAAEGEPLDPNFHNVMMRDESSELPEGSIVQVLAKGYKIGDRVIRHTMVKSS